MLPKKQKNQEKPFYVLKQVKKRSIIPNTTLLIILCVIFYLGILLNLSLIDIPLEQENLIKMSSLIFLIVLFITAVIFYIIKSFRTYLFYQDKIVFGRKNIRYQEIVNTSEKKNLLDKMFKTYSSHLGKKFFIINISQEISLDNYLQKLIKYAKAKENKLKI